jgi:long-chain acyl-CoA synthetase
MEAWTARAGDTSRGPVPEQFVYICALPLYHVFRAGRELASSASRIGTLNVSDHEPARHRRFRARTGEVQVQRVAGVNTLYNALAGTAEIPQARLLEPAHRERRRHGRASGRGRKVAGDHRCPIIEGYGLSETSPVATCNPILNRRYTGRSACRSRVPNRDPRRRGRPVPLGQPGEIAIRGPQVMAGYWQRPDETAKVDDPDGFFKSGDVGIMDERGYIRIVDRKKDMILVSGFKRVSRTRSSA